MGSPTVGLRKRGSLIVRGSLAIMVVLFGGAAIYRSVHQRSASKVITVTAPIYEFYASPDTFSCELDNPGTSSSIRPGAYCEKATPTRTANVVLSPSGSLKVCVGLQCGSNAGLNTPTFFSPTIVKSGPFTCAVGSNDVTCRVVNGKGFRMTMTSITPVA